MAGLTLADLSVLLLYFVGITILGVWAGRRVQGLDDFVMPRRFGKWMMLMYGFGTGTHSDQAVGVSAKSYLSGLSGIWYQWLWLFATPFYWLIAAMLRRLRVLTTADAYALRFDQSVSLLFAVVGFGGYIVSIGLMLKGSSELIDACTAGHVSAEWAIPVMTVMFVTYGMAGGLSAAIITDFVQGVLTILFSIILLPMVLNAVGGLDGLRTSLNELSPDYDMLSLVTPGEIGVFYVVVISINGLIGIVAQPHAMGVGAGRTEIDSQFSLVGGGFLKRLCTVAWCLIGVAAVVCFAGEKIDNPDRVFGEVAYAFLPGLLPGLMGLFIAALLASVMSSCDAFMVASGALVTENCYRPYVRNRTPRHYLWVTRIAMLAVVGLGLLFAYRVESVIHGLEIFWKIAPMMGVAFWMGLFWRRATVLGAWAATIGGFLAWWLSSLDGFAAMVYNLSLNESMGFVHRNGEELSIELPWQMVFYLLASIVCGVLVSLVTPRVPKEKLDRFYGLIRTPVWHEEKLDRVGHLPVGKEPAPRRVFFDRGELELPVPSRWMVGGFLASCVLVGIMIGGLYLLVFWGAS